MDDELRLQLEQSIEMVVNELSTPEDNVSANADFQDNIETANECNVVNPTSTTSASATMDPIMDSMNDLEGTLDPDLQAVCDVLRMANASPTLRRPTKPRNASETTSTVSNTASRESANGNVKCEPRDAALADILSGVESLPVSSSTATISSSNGTLDRQSNPIDLLTMLSLDKKPSALSILPVKSDKSSRHLSSTKVANSVEYSLTPNVTIKSVPSSANSIPFSNRCLSTNEECSNDSRKTSSLSLLSADGRLARDGNMFAQSPDSFSSLPCSSVGSVSTTKTTNSLTCCSTLPNRSVDVSNNYNMFFNKTSANARPISCSYTNYNCRRMSPYPPQYQHMSYTGIRSPGSRVNAPAARSFNPNSSPFGTSGSCCTSIASPMSPSVMMMNSKPTSYSALPSLLPPSPLNPCRMPLSPTSPSFARSREYSNMFPDSTGASTEAMAHMQQQQSFRPSSNWGTPLNAFHTPASRSSFSLASLKATRGSSMSAVLQHSNSPIKNQLFPSGSTGFGYPVSVKNGTNNVTGTGTNAYGSSLNDEFSSSSMPFPRGQCCFSSQIQCFNAACDNTAQQHVSIIQHSTRLSNLKSNSMDSISSLLQYHSYFKKY